MSPEKIEATISGARGNATTFKMECANQSTRINPRDSARVSVAFFFSFRSMHRIGTINSLDFTRTYEAQLVSSRISTSSFFPSFHFLLGFVFTSCTVTLYSFSYTSQFSCTTRSSTTTLQQWRF